ncbi:MAG TPA: pyruvate kinase, partial [Treponema sp.]|nr:pyruvate kinase [Treponema sp.]
MTSRKTKIVCSMGPTTNTDDIVIRMINAGMNIARFNFSHGDHAGHKEMMERVRRASQAAGKSVALMMDTKGPEIRSGIVEGNGKITITKGDAVLVSVDDCPVTAVKGKEPAHISLSWKELPSRVSPGIKILIADGLLELDVKSTDGKIVKCEAANTAVIGSKKNVNLIGIHAGLPIMSEQDKDDIKFCVEMNCDFIAASFTSFASEVHEIRHYLDSLGSNMKIISKIENEEGLDNIREIAEAADGIMVARGDLGVQLPTERIPLAQKHIIEECRMVGKPVITATQMLDSMIVNPRPTRAELTDVANAIFDGTDAVMLSGETANGAYPVEAVETMARIAQTVEDSDEYCRRIKTTVPEMESDVTIGRIMARMAYETADKTRAMVIVVPTMSGNTARMISTFRPEQSILAVTPDAQVQRQLLLNWGVFPLVSPIADDSEEMVQNAVKIAIDAGFVHQSDRIILCAGIPLASPIPVNTIRVLLIGNVLARGRTGGYGDLSSGRMTGRIVRASTPDKALMLLRHKSAEILLCPDLTADWIPILRIVDGVVCEEPNEIPADTMKLVNQNLVWISDAGKAVHTIENGLTVTIDG